jgi:hypothetical protein
MDHHGPATGRLPLLRAVLATGLLLGCTLAAFTPAFQQNDDVVMAMIASGRGLSVQPDAHLVYVNVVLGELLRRAYGWAPALPWYGLVLIAVLAAVEASLLRARFARDARTPLSWLAFLGCFGAVASVFVVRLQFTAVAGLAAGAGLALWIASLQPKPAEGGGRGGAPGGLLLPALLVLLGALLRFQALLLALVVALPLALVRLAAAGRPRALRALVGLGAVLLLALALQLRDRAWYERDPGWQEFGVLNAWRARIVDYGAGADGEGGAPERRVGWSANDALMLRRWFYADRSVYPVEKMRALVGAAPLAWPAAAEARDRLQEAFDHPSFLPLALVLPLLLAGGDARERRLTLLLSLLPGLVVVSLLAVFLRAPEHVGLPALAFAPTALLATAVAQRRRARHARWWWPALVLAGVGAALALRQDRADSLTAAEDNRDLRRTLARLAVSPQQLYVEWAGAFRYESVLPLEDTRYLSGLRLYSLGWPQRSPIADRMLRSFAIDDVFRSLYERPDVRLLMNPAWRDSLQVYAREHYGVALRFPEGVPAPSFTAFRVERADAPAATAALR